MNNRIQPTLHTIPQEPSQQQPAASPKKIKTSVYLPHDLHTILKNYSLQYDQSMTSIIEKALKKYLK